jgi:hypothetical protein
MAQVVTGRDKPDRERQDRRAGQRGGGDDADVDRAVADRRHIGGQHDDREPIAKAAQPTRRVEQGDVGTPRRRVLGLVDGADGGTIRHGSHGAGRKSQIAAGSRAEARTASMKRSISGAKNEVRAPATVGMRAVR